MPAFQQRPVYTKEMFREYRIGALLLMGGKGERFGSTMPKQFHHLSGKSIYLHTLDSFIESALFDEIVLTCPKNWMEAVRREVPSFKIRIVEGGSSRQESSFQGLLGFSQPPDYVVIHDAVRPFVSKEVLLQNIVNAIEVGAADTCIPSADTLVYAPSGAKIESIPNREDYLRGQTPQSFSFPLILNAHQTTNRKNCTDDCRLVRDLNHPIAVVKGDESNIKITSELDLLIAEQLFRLRSFSQKPNQRKFSLSGLFCIVGGSGGIGSEIAQTIRNFGGEVITLSRHSEPIKLDLRSPDSIKKAFQELPPLDGLINCAGMLHVGPLERLTVEQIEELIDVNLKGLILCCKMASLKNGAHIINIASSSYTRGRKDQSVYSSSKAGVVNFTQALAEERPELHIHAITPKRVNTPMRRKSFPDEDESLLLEPQAVAEEVLNLLLSSSTGSLVEVRKK